MRAFLTGLFFSMVCFSAFSQIQIDDRTSNSIKDRGYLGIGIGGLGLGTGSFGTYYSIGLTPQVGYMINPHVSSGLAFEYQYTGYPDAHQHYSQFGWYPYLRFNIKKIFIQTDYDWYRVPTFYSNERKTFNRFLVGAGYFSPSNRGRGGMNFLVSYDLLYSANSPFNSPLSFRIFWTF